MSRLHCLVLESDAVAASALSAVIASEGWSVAAATSLAEARRLVAMQPPDLVFADLGLSRDDAWVFLSDRDLRRAAPVAITTSMPEVETAVMALRRGAVDYLSKPVESALVRALLGRCQAISATAQSSASSASGSAHPGVNRFVGRSDALRRAVNQIRLVAPTSVNVMLFGESGTGKEVAARTIHEYSSRSRQAFLAVNCGAVSSTLMESEFFGHERGSFTGADRLRHGYFEQAQGGTLFLDEVTEMPIDLQVKLLRVLEAGTFLRVGSSREQKADVRIISATNRSLPEAVAEGALRRDLLYRLNVFPIHLPPLRERGDDVLLIADAFLQELNEQGRSHLRFSDAAKTTLLSHGWPGNVRELRNAVQRAYVMADGPVIRSMQLDTDLEPLARGSLRSKDATDISLPVGTSIADAERLLIEATLKRFDGQKEQSAAVLGISLKTLYNRLRTYGPIHPEKGVTLGKRNCQ